MWGRRFWSSGEKHVDKGKAMSSKFLSPLKIMDTRRYTPPSTKMPCRRTHRGYFGESLEVWRNRVWMFLSRLWWKLQCPLVVRRTYSLCYVPWCSMIVFLLLTVLMNEGKHVVFRQFVRVDPRLGVVNSDTLLPSPKQPVLMTCTKKQENREKQIKKVMK